MKRYDYTRWFDKSDELIEFLNEHQNFNVIQIEKSGSSSYYIQYRAWYYEEYVEPEKNKKI